MKRTVPQKTASAKESQEILNDIRHLVQAIRIASVDSEKQSGISTAQLLILQRLSEEDKLSVNDLAGRTMTHQSSVSVALQKLEKKGLIKRSISDNDGRKYRFSLTKKGRAVMKKAPHPVHDTLVVALEKLDPKVRKNFAHGFSAFLQVANISSASPVFFVFLPRILKRIVVLIAGIAT